ncbi:hypothetical protein Vadar_020277 [Vaccinium darrowii]|uniref:Uncharacterized protein n=1 Tax=Vaccinium darrowii TaxID=229202 RepID=A0ACB7Z5Y4_9ERIC|nr:hypothetical protein Vadar_020277 [Vaccinium darrowii]
MANFDIQYRPRTAIEAQVLADFIAELTPGEEKQKKEEPNPSLPEQSTEDLHAPVAIEDVANNVLDEESNKEIDTADLIQKPLSEGETSPSTDEDQATVPFSTWHMFHGNTWKLHVDGASNQRGAGVGVVLISPEGVIHENAISIEFPASNNEAEYEALIAGLRLAEAMDVKTLMVYSDSQLVVNQFNGEYDAKDERMAKYLDIARSIAETFEELEVHQVGREHNAHADALARLGSACKASEQLSISFGTISSPSFDPPRTQMMNIELSPSWMDELVFYLRDDKLPEDRREAHRIRCKAANYWLSPTGSLYRRSRTGPYLMVVHHNQVHTMLHELHAGNGGCHSGGRSIAHRAITQGYWWPKMKEDAEEFVRKCHKCQLFKPMIHQPAEDL